MAESKAPATGALRNERSEDYDSVYANNVTLEATFWDLKLSFGEVDQGMATISQHTGVTIPWSMAKIFAFLLQAQIIGYELQNGQIKIPRELIPAPFPPPTEEQQRADPNAKHAYEAISKLRNSFVHELKP